MVETTAPPDDENLDRAILSAARESWLKVARVVYDAERQVRSATAPPSDEKWTERIEALVAAGMLEGAGELSNWRFSEVRLAHRIVAERA